MDLAYLDVKSAADKGAEMPLKNPLTGEETDAVLLVLGRDSPRVAAAMREFDRRKARGDKVDDEERGLALLCEVVIGWDNIELDGEVLQYSKENARKLFTDPRTDWIGEQVGPFALSRRNFAGNLGKP